MAQMGTELGMGPGTRRGLFVTDLASFNSYVTSANKKSDIVEGVTVFERRVIALRGVRDNHGELGINKVLWSFRVLYPQWSITVKDSLESKFCACVEYLKKMSEGNHNSDLFSQYKNSLADTYKLGVVHSSPRKTAAYKVLERITEAPQEYCFMHPEKKAATRGLCSMCYQRIQRLVVCEMINEKTPEKVVLDILRIPNLGRGKRGFITEARFVLAKYEGVQL